MLNFHFTSLHFTSALGLRCLSMYCTLIMSHDQTAALLRLARARSTVHQLPVSSEAEWLCLISPTARTLGRLVAARLSPRETPACAVLEGIGHFGPEASIMERDKNPRPQSPRQH